MKGANIAKLSVNGEFEVALLQVCLPPFPVVTSLPTLLIALLAKSMVRPSHPLWLLRATTNQQVQALSRDLGMRRFTEAHLDQTLRN